MYIHEGEMIRVFTNTLPKDMVEGKVVSITDDFIHLKLSDNSLFDICWDYVDDVKPCPHPDPKHMFDRYSLMKGDKIKLIYYEINGDRHEVIGDVVRVSGSVIILNCDYINTYKIITPYNIERLVFIYAVTRKPPVVDDTENQSEEKTGEEKNEEM